MGITEQVQQRALICMYVIGRIFLEIYYRSGMYKCARGDHVIGAYTSKSAQCAHTQRERARMMHREVTYMIRSYVLYCTYAFLNNI